MKTYEIKDLLKSDILVVELPEDAYYEIFKHGIYIKDDNGERGFIEGSYTLLGSPDEIKNNEKWDVYKPCKGRMETETAKEPLLSAIESAIFWENPYKKRFENDADFQVHADFIEAESRTFDRSRTLIFVKN